MRPLIRQTPLTTTASLLNEYLIMIATPLLNYILAFKLKLGSASYSVSCFIRFEKFSLVCFSQCYLSNSFQLSKVVCTISFRICSLRSCPRPSDTLSYQEQYNSSVLFTYFQLFSANNTSPITLCLTYDYPVIDEFGFQACIWPQHEYVNAPVLGGKGTIAE